MKRRKLDNKGSTLVLVIVAMSIVAILAVVSLWISLANYQMKTTNIKVKDNFYSAEAVLNEIRTGLQGDVSVAYTTALTDVFEQYALYDEKGRQEMFAKKYVSTLRSRIKSADSDLNYDIDKIKTYVTPQLLADGAKPSAVIETTSATDGKNGLMNTYENGVVLKGIKVTFTDEKGFVSVIETDIALNIPQVDLTMSEDLPDVFSYGIIANQGAGCRYENNSDVQRYLELSGNVYLGCPTDAWASGNAYGGNDVSLYMHPKHTAITVKDCEYFIASGNIPFKDNMTLETPVGCQLWARNLGVWGNNASVKLLGNTYLADDLTLSGVGASAVLGSNKNGKFVGFGNRVETPTNNSAIIINGKDASLDMTELGELIIAGRAFINTGSIPVKDGYKNNHIQTGQSIAIKGNQLSYLVPAECLWTIGDGPDARSYYGKNPLSWSQEYEKIKNQKETYTEVNVNVVSKKTGHPLSYYLEDGQTIDDVVEKVFNNGGNGEDRVYYFLNLSPEKAALYYEDYYNQDSSKLQLYSSFYTDCIKVNEDAVVYTAGDYSLYDENQLSLKKGIIDGIDIDAESAVLDKIYTALQKKLVRNYSSLTNEQLANNVFNNIINVENLKKITATESNGIKRFTYWKDGKREYSAVVANGNYTYNDAADSLKTRLIVATGDVWLLTNFTGTVICNGRVFFQQDYKTARVAAAPDEVFQKLLKLSSDSSNPDALKLYEVFVDGNAYMSNGIVGSGEDDEDKAGTVEQFVNYSDVIIYQNWTKK